MIAPVQHGAWVSIRPLGCTGHLTARKGLDLRSAPLEPARNVVVRDSADSGSARSVLDAFFYGKALAEVVNERLGAAVEDFLSDFGKWDAETRQALREFQDEVEARARADMLQAKDGSSMLEPQSTSTTRGPTIATPPDLDVTVDDLRAEVASARAAAQQLKNKRRSAPTI